jgi:succinyl-CoA synthetase beta subunit
LWEIFATRDAELAEINPLAVLQDSSLIALDAKLSIDDKSTKRQASFLEGIELVEIAPTESPEQRRLEARKSGIPTYIEMEGNIGVIVDGAGSGMLTLDLVSNRGGRTRVYLEMGGEITPKLMETGLMTTLRVPGVTSVLINLIGGLNRMDEMAVGISNYATHHPNQVPIVVRMCGTKQEEGREILVKCGIEFFDVLDEAVEEAVSFSRGA